MSKKAIAIIAALTLVLTLALGAFPAAAAPVVSVFEDFEDGLGAWTATPATTSFAPQTITIAHKTTDALMGNGSLALSLVPPDDAHIGWWQAIGMPWNKTEDANWEGIVFRMDARSIALDEKTNAALMNAYFGMAEGTAPGTFIRFNERIKFITLEGEDVTIDFLGEGGNYYSQFCYIPKDFNGYVFCNYSGMAEKDTALAFEVSMVDDSYTIEGEIVTFDQVAYYKGTDFNAVIAELGNAPVVTASPVPATEKPKDNAKDFPWLYVGIGAVVVVVLAVVIVLVTRKKVK